MPPLLPALMLLTLILFRHALRFSWYAAAALLTPFICCVPPTPAAYYYAGEPRQLLISPAISATPFLIFTIRQMLSRYAALMLSFFHYASLNIITLLRCHFAAPHAAGFRHCRCCFHIRYFAIFDYHFSYIADGFITLITTPDSHYIFRIRHYFDATIPIAAISVIIIIAGRHYAYFAAARLRRAIFRRCRFHAVSFSAMISFASHAAISYYDIRLFSGCWYAYWCHCHYYFAIIESYDAVADISQLSRCQFHVIAIRLFIIAAIIDTRHWLRWYYFRRCHTMLLIAIFVLILLLSPLFATFRHFDYAAFRWYFHIRFRRYNTIIAATTPLLVAVLMPRHYWNSYFIDTDIFHATSLIRFRCHYFHYCHWCLATAY